MAHLRPLSQVKIIRILEKNGFKKTKSGRHITFKKKLPDDSVLTTWLPHHKKVTVLVVGYIIKQTGKPKEEFEK